MKLLWLTPEFPSSINNTKGIYIFRTVKELSRHYDLYVICLYPASPPIFEMLKYLFDWKRIYKEWKENYPKNSNVPEGMDPSKVIYLRYYRLPRGISHHIEGWFAYFQASQILKKIISPETIVHANWIFPAGTLAEIISKKYKVPFLISLLGSDVNRLVEGTKFWRSARQLLLSANKVTAVTNDLFDKCSSKSINIQKSKSFQIDNIYESERFIIKDKNSCREILNIDRNVKIIFFAGGLVPVKNVDILIKAFMQLDQTHLNASLYIAGSGSEEGILRRLVAGNKIEKEIIFLGSLQSDQLINYYNAADVFCLPSKSEGLPNVVVESLFCGTPVVASNVGGIPSLIEKDENGYLVEPNSIDELSYALKSALNREWNPQKIRRSISHLLPERVIEKYHSLYKSMSGISFNG